MLWKTEFAWGDCRILQNTFQDTSRRPIFEPLTSEQEARDANHLTATIVMSFGCIIPLLQFRWFRYPLSPMSMSRQAQTYVPFHSKIAALGNHKSETVYFGGRFNNIVTSNMYWFPLLCIILLMLILTLIFREYFPPPLLPLVRKSTEPHLLSRLNFKQWFISKFACLVERFMQK